MKTLQFCKAPPTVIGSISYQLGLTESELAELYFTIKGFQITVSLTITNVMSWNTSYEVLQGEDREIGDFGSVTKPPYAQVEESVDPRRTYFRKNAPGNNEHNDQFLLLSSLYKVGALYYPDFVLSSQRSSNFHGYSFRSDSVNGALVLTAANLFILGKTIPLYLDTANTEASASGSIVATPIFWN